MRYRLCQEFPNDFLSQPKGTTLTLYQRTHLTQPDNEQDPIRFKNLIKAAKEKGSLPEDVLELLDQLSKDKEFWLYNSHGLALFASQDGCQIFRLNAEVPNLSYVGESFYLLPLLTYFDALDHAYVLAFDQSEFRVLEGNQNGVQTLDLPDVVQSFKELYPVSDADSNLNVGSYGGRQASFHGHRAKPEEVEKDRLKFFRHIDKVLTDHLAPHDPIVLVGLPEHQASFRKIVKNNKVLDAGIEQPMASLAEKDFLQKFGEILQSAKQEHVHKQTAKIEKAIQDKRYVTGFDAVQKFIEEGRVDTLYISEDLNRDPLADSTIEAVNRMTFEVLEKSGHFFVLEQARIDRKELVSAVLRY